MTRRVPAGAPIVTAATMRAAEERVFASGIAADVLMQTAATAVATEVARLAAGRPVLVLAGPGRNGGDAVIAASVLNARGHDVALATIDGRCPPGWGGAVTTLDAATPRPVLIDGLFGIGLSRPLDDTLARQFARLRADAFTIAIDVPSGFGVDDSTDLGGAGADVTIALAALKPVHVIGAGAGASGHVLLADIGVPVDTAWRTLDTPRIPSPGRDAHKFTRGMVAVVGGAMPGAARLAARAAMAAGAGYVVLAADWTPGLPDALVQRPLGAALLADERVGALLIGPGLGRDDAARWKLDAALASGRRLVVDGDALSLLGRDGVGRLAGVDAILTPHGGEFDRLFGGGGGDKITRTLAAAVACGCTIVHKGADTVIAHPDGRVTISSAASPWLATAGSGDVLAGLIAARMAAGDLMPAETAAWLHARAAGLAGPALAADRLVEHVPQALDVCL
ncbi:NAD(P)H-hydrate dehydratase [Sphingomonas sp. RS2018]